MFDDTNKEKDQDNLEPFNVEINVKNSKEFITNNIPKILKNNMNKYKKLNDQKQFFSSKTEKFSIKYGYCHIVLNFFFSFTFYFLLLTSILTIKVMTIILTIIIYILGEIIQISIIPNLFKYKSKLDFESEMNRILNGYSMITFHKEKRNQNSFQYPCRYTIDVTGEINIPKKINFVKIGEIQFFVEKKDFDNFDEKYITLYKKNIFIKDYYIKTFYNTSLFYDNKELILYHSSFYNLNSNSEGYSINFVIKFLSIFLLQWIYALISLLKKEEFVIIYPAKLITINDIQESPTKIVVHGNELNHEKYITGPIGLEDLTKLEKEYEEYKKKEKIELKRRKKKREEKQKKIEEKERIEREKEEEEKRKREEEERKREEEERLKRENTKTLSRFSDNNYSIRVYRVYEDVYLDLFVWQKDEDSYHDEMYLGKLNTNIKEERNHLPQNNSYLYTPNGFDIKIQITHYEYRYNISIGEKFNRSFRYYE